MLEKATPINCKNLVRLAVALSEMADTVSSNCTNLKEMLRNTDENLIIRQVDKTNEVVKMSILSQNCLSLTQMFISY